MASDRPRSSSVTFPPFTPNSIRLSPITRIDRIFPKRQENSCSGGVSLRPSLKTNGIIEIIPHNDTTALHIRVVDYENWTNISTLLGEKKENTQKASNEKFRLFWDDYHNILQLPKENIAKAQRIWKKLSEKEQQLAIDHIEEYYYHQTNMKFTLHACSYLSNKAFLNEYEY